jgi:hypothetical protein
VHRHRLTVRTRRRLSHLLATVAIETASPAAFQLLWEEAVSVPASLSSLDDAIRLADVALGNDDLVAIVEGDAKLVLSFTVRTPPDAVLRVDELLLDALGDDDSGNRLVLATRRRTGPAMVLEDELARWRHMVAEHRGRSLRLCDWLVFVRDEVVLSVAELAGPPPVWT